MAEEQTLSENIVGIENMEFDKRFNKTSFRKHNLRFLIRYIEDWLFVSRLTPRRSLWSLGREGFKMREILTMAFGPKMT